MGQTGWQRLFKVELPMAKRTIIVGINQTTMAALSMATIAAFINGPGLGQPVVRALNALRVGDAFVPGICIVLMAIMLDRVTTAASEHGRGSPRPGQGQARPTGTCSCCWLPRSTIALRLPVEALHLRRTPGSRHSATGSPTRCRPPSTGSRSTGRAPPLDRRRLHQRHHQQAGVRASQARRGSSRRWPSSRSRCSSAAGGPVSPH